MMKKNVWGQFTELREQFRCMVEEVNSSLPFLLDMQQRLVDCRSDAKGAVYTVETAVVYNGALDEITNDDEIKLILVADNPGRREQAAENRRYLVGPSGKIAQKFFSDNPELGIDFRKNVIILNKTPVHTPRTAELRRLCSMDINGGGRLGAMLDESQKKMAELLFGFHEALECPVWIIGYSEMKRGGIFEVYTEKLKALYANKKDLYKQIYFYRHFSMNQFTVDLKRQGLPGETVTKSLKRIGTAYRKRILG